MILRNKKTGEIINYRDLVTDEFLIDLFSKDFNGFNSEINKILEEWEGYNPDWVTENILGHLRMIDKKLKALSDYLNINFEIKYGKKNKNKCILVVKEKGEE